MGLYALVDCNNFYVSCERAFNPKLEGRPVVVLSNNDGCVVSRSKEAKKLEIPMGVPYFKIAHLRKKGLEVFSSNYPLYGDLSNRIMTILAEECASLEVYSIDEAFLFFSRSEEEALFRSLTVLREKIWKWVGIPVTIGLAPTRTLAKLACYHAKKKEMPVFSLCHSGIRESLLKNTPINEVWGIGRKGHEKLLYLGVRSAYDFIQADLSVIEKTLGVVGKRKVFELEGIDSLESDVNDGKRDSISSSKSFSHAIEKLEDLEAAVISYATRCVEKLRQQESLCYYISVYITTGAFSEGVSYARSQTISVHGGTDSLKTVIQHALEQLRQIYRPGYAYKKAGVGLSGVIDKSLSQLCLFPGEGQNEEDDKLMEVMDKIKAKMGRDALQFGVTKEKAPWKSNSNYRSPHYTTEWTEILKVKA